MDVSFNGVLHPMLKDVPFDKRWDLLRPVIERLYVHENKALPEVIQVIRAQYGFDANETAYKYRINQKWKLRKNIPASKTEAMLNKSQARAAAGRSSHLQFHGRDVAPLKLRRHLKEQRRKQMLSRKGATDASQGTGRTISLCSALTTNIIISWNMPYGAMMAPGIRPIDQFSPFATGSTPSDVAIMTPAESSALTPGGPSSPLVTLRKNQVLERAHSFLDGRHNELWTSLDAQERLNGSNWLYQFWLYSVTTAKHWNRGPRHWTSKMLGFEGNRGDDFASSPVPSGSFQSSSPAGAGDHIARPIPQPSHLCRWAIHTEHYGYDQMDPEGEPSNVGGPDPDDETTWRRWPTEVPEANIQDTLWVGIKNNSFSSLNPEELPMALGQVLRGETRSAADLLLESLAFSIIGRNSDLVDEILVASKKTIVDISVIHPLHLATTYLDGSKSCCNIFDRLLDQDARQNLINQRGHSVLDNLMIAIVKHHTTCLPGTLDDDWKTETRFPGAEVDICGRWDADSDCIRALSARGNLAIPREWKHKFCHTSTQVICHCIEALYYGHGKKGHAVSGLFLKHCTNATCGLKLQLQPLHTAVLVAFLLVQYGCEDEDLFGMMAVMMSLLRAGISPLDTAPVSLPLLMREVDTEGCTHREMTPIELTVELHASFKQYWPERRQVGWHSMLRILERSQAQWSPDAPRGLNASPPADAVDFSFEDDDTRNVRTGAGESLLSLQGSADDDSSDDDSATLNLQEEALCRGPNSRYDEHDNYFGRDEVLGTTWAVIQTELLTYRRVSAGDAWNSDHIDMQMILEYLRGGWNLSIGLVDDGLMQLHCVCGKFEEDFLGCVTMDNVSSRYFANLEDWSRITVITMPRRIFKNT